MKKQNCFPRKSRWIGWVEPMQSWINYAQTIGKIAKESSLFEKKATTKEIFGLNLVLANREARYGAPSGKDFPLKTHWAALCAAREFVGKKEKSFIVGWLTGFEPVLRVPQTLVLTTTL